MPLYLKGHFICSSAKNTRTVGGRCAEFIQRDVADTLKQGSRYEVIVNNILASCQYCGRILLQRSCACVSGSASCTGQKLPAFEFEVKPTQSAIELWQRFAYLRP